MRDGRRPDVHKSPHSDSFMGEEAFSGSWREVGAQDRRVMIDVALLSDPQRRSFAIPAPEQICTSVD